VVKVRRTIGALGALSILVAGCSGLPQAVRGIQQPGAATVAAEMRAPDASRVTAGMLAGSSSYIGANADGSLIGFLTADGFIRWYRVR
jgi:hypothetical protein